VTAGCPEAPLPDLKPFVPHDSAEREFTLKAVLAGILMAAIFGAANAYIGMKAGQAVAATIPAAVIAIALFRLPFLRGGVLEQNLTRPAARFFCPRSTAVGGYSRILPPPSRMPHPPTTQSGQIMC
jgi:hypothetical protein